MRYGVVGNIFVFDHPELVTEKISKAFEHFMKGVLLFNDPNCLCKLGDMYRYGECIEKDKKMAYALNKTAHSVHLYCEEVFADIIVRLGECELYGIGTNRMLYLQ